MISTIIVIGLTSFLATILSSMSGGGSSVITLPVFLSLGIPFPLGTSIQKISAVFWVLPAAWNYLKGTRVDWKFLMLFSCIGLVGVFFGVQFVLEVPERMLEIIVGVLILIIIIGTNANRTLGLQKRTNLSRCRKFFAYPFALILGFYEGIFGSGNGILLGIIGIETRGFDFTEALGYYFAAAFPWVVFAAYLLVSQGQFNIGYTIPAVLGSVCGSYIGSAFARYKGNTFIKNTYSVIGVLLALKLLLNV